MCPGNRDGLTGQPPSQISEAIDGGGTSVNVTPLLLCPLTVTTTGPVAVPAGTLVVMDVALHAVTAAATPLNITMLVPCACPKSVPAMVTACATMPVAGVRDAIAGGGMTSNGTPLLACPLTVTTTAPVTAVGGTIAVMLVSAQAPTDAAVPLNAIVLVLVLHRKSLTRSRPDRGFP